MSELHEDVYVFPVRPDPHDSRDRTFNDVEFDSDDPFLLGTEQEAVRRLFDELLDASTPPPPGADCADYEALTDPPWHQRGLECTGFALAAIANYHIRKGTTPTQLGELTPEARNDLTASRRMLYEMAQIYDSEAYEEGSTLRGALRGWRKLGVAAEALWPYHPDDEHGEKYGTLGLKRVVDAVSRPGGSYFRIDSTDIAKMKRALTGGHPLYASAQVHVGWYRQFLPDASGTIQRRSDDKLLGGHAFVIYGYDERGFKIQNSWGSQWANGGFGVLTYDDWAEHGQEVWFVVPRPRPKKVDLVPELPSDAAAASTFSRMWRHLVTLADDGRLSTAGRYYLDKGAVATLLYLFQEQTKHWKCRRLAVFADGGYWATNATVAALEPLRDRLMAAEIYPIFLLWDTPWFDDMQGWLYGQHNLETLLDCDDRDLLAWWNGTIDGQEVGLGLPMAKLAAAESVAPMMWSEIRRRSHAACAGPSGGARALADSIAYKWGQRPFDIHLIAHGAGDLLMSELAQLLPAPVTSASLWAPATTMERFRESYGPMLDDGCLRHLEVFALDDDVEQTDRVGPMPRSLLSLVADVLDADIDVNKAIKDWTKDVALHSLPMPATATVTSAGPIAPPAPPRTPSHVWVPDPEPVLGMQRFLSTDPDIARHTATGRLDVQVVAGRTHTGLQCDDAVISATIAVIETPEPSAGATPEIDHGSAEAPVSNPIPLTVGDPLDRAAPHDPLSWGVVPL